MAWYLTTSLAALRRDLDAAFPTRDRKSDGTIGDAAHQASTSGHNPDDTPGSKAEYTDADTRPEVRAYDADNDLRDPRGVDFQQVIDAILATPADRDRLAYIIHRRRIWRKRTGWRREVYTGSSPHDEHGHFSGDPIHDENGAPWTSILSFKEASMADTTPNQVNDWTGLRRIESLHKNLPATIADATGGGEPNGLHTALAGITDTLNGLVQLLGVGGTGATHEQLVAAMKGAILDPEVLAALKAVAFQGAQQAEQE
jgi:hypothetical protein